MGAARLRITSFPTIGNSREAHEWVAPHGSEFTAKASFAHDDLTAMDDGIEPMKSSDMNKSRFTWWDHKGTTEWVEYDFSKPTTISATSIYWFDDTGTGRCRTPQSWTVDYKEGTEWKPVTGASVPRVDLDRYNRCAFAPVSTTALRVEVRLKENFSGGILRWKVETPSK